MWIASKFGFFSIVKDISTNQNVHIWMVRARVKSDIENVADLLEIEHGDIIESDDSDYQYRILVNLPQLEDLMSEFAVNVDYPNFKDMIAETDDQMSKVPFYTRVWSMFAEEFGTGLWNKLLREGNTEGEELN